MIFSLIKVALLTFSSVISSIGKGDTRSITDDRVSLTYENKKFLNPFDEYGGNVFKVYEDLTFSGLTGTTTLYCDIDLYDSSYNFIKHYYSINASYSSYSNSYVLGFYYTNVDHPSTDNAYINGTFNTYFEDKYFQINEYTNFYYDSGYFESPSSLIKYCFYCVGGFSVELPNTNELNLNGLYDNGSGFFVNKNQLYVNGLNEDRYYFFKGLGSDIDGNIITGLYVELGSAMGDYFYDSNNLTYVEIPSTNPSGYTDNIPYYVFVDGAYVEYKDGTIQQFIIKDGVIGVSASDSSELNGWSVPTRWRYRNINSKPNYFNIYYFDSSWSYVLGDDLDLGSVLNGNPVNASLFIFNMLSHDKYNPIFTETLINVGSDSYHTNPLGNAFGLINTGLSSLTSFFGVMVLPQISLGALILIPFAISLLLFILNFFKR